MGDFSIKDWKISIPAAFIAVVCTIVVIVIDLECFQILELFSGGAKLEPMMYNLSIGYLTSFIFYIIVVVFPDVQKRRSFRIYLNHTIREFYREIHQITMAMQISQGVGSFEFYSDNSKFDQLFHKAKPSDPAWPLVGGKTLAQQITYLPTYLELISVNIYHRSFGSDPYLDILLTRISKNGIFFFAKNSPIANLTTLSTLGSAFSLTLSQLKELSSHCKSKYSIPDMFDYLNSDAKQV